MGARCASAAAISPLAGKPLAREFDDAVLLADDRGPIAAFRVGERLRPEACAAIEALQARGMTVLIASGDAASKVAEHCRATECRHMARARCCRRTNWPG